jgi:hypothetical protein
MKNFKNQKIFRLKKKRSSELINEIDVVRSTINKCKNFLFIKNYFEKIGHISKKNARRRNI